MHFHIQILALAMALGLASSATIPFPSENRAVIIARSAEPAPVPGNLTGACKNAAIVCATTGGGMLLELVTSATAAPITAALQACGLTRTAIFAARTVKAACKLVK